MFTLRQITAAGFFGVYSGCVPLTVDLARLPYWRGAWIGVLYGALNHFLVMWLMVLAVVGTASLCDDFLFHRSISWVILVSLILLIQALSALGCRMMGRYFHAPRVRSESFDRAGLLSSLKPRDTGKRSVLHDVVTNLERCEGAPDRRYSWFWIVLFSALSVGSMAYWLFTLYRVCLEAIWYGLETDGAWYARLMGSLCIPLVVLLLLHATCLVWLCRDMSGARK